MQRFQDLVTALRRVRVEHGIPQAKRVPAVVSAGDYREEIRSQTDALATLARLSSVELVDEAPPPTGRARAFTSAGLEASIALEDAVDLEAERARLRKRLERAAQEQERLESKLSNQEFTSKAPEAVVDKERARLQEASATRVKLQEQLRAVGG